MIVPFWGEFLFDPCPLEMSMNLCSHGCAYCFSCNRGYKGWSGISSVKRQLSRIQKNQVPEGNLEAHLIKNGYPLVLSNRSDPFAKSNRKDMPELLKLLKENNIPIFIQTKGGEGLELCASQMNESLFYFTVSYWDDSIRNRIEKNAPSIEQRFEYIKTVKALGHNVIVGITPMDENWLPAEDFKKLTEHLKNIGVEAVFMQGLHISKSTHKLTEAKRAAMADALPETGRNLASEKQFAYYQKCVSILSEIGLCGYGVGQWEPTKFMDSFRKSYNKTFPVTDDFIRWAWKNKNSGEYVTFDEYFSIIGSKLPDGLWKLDHAIHANNRNIAREKSIPQFMSFKELLKIIWSDDRFLQCPAKFRLFAFDGIDRKNRKLDDKNGLPLMLVNKNGFKRGQKYTERREK